MQCGEEAPQRGLGRQLRNLQDPGQHGIARNEPQLAQAAEADIDAQNHCQNELVAAHRLCDPLHRQRIFQQRLKTQLLQHGGYG